MCIYVHVELYVFAMCVSAHSTQEGLGPQELELQ